MNTMPNFADLWKLLSTEEQQDACVAFWQSTSPTKEGIAPMIAERLAQQLHFRPQFFNKRTNEDKARHLVSRIARPPLANFLDDVLREYLLMRKPALLGDFLDAAGIANVGGLVPDEAEPADADRLAKGIEAIRDRYIARDVLIYLALLANQSASAGGGYWAALAAAMDESGYDPAAEFVLVASGEKARETEPDEAQSEPEAVEAFTTLDNLLIKTVIAAANEAEGALGLEQLEDLVEETIALSAERQRTYFHRGYLHAVFTKPYAFHFPGENEERRTWYFCGVLLGLLRRAEGTQCVALLKREKTLTRELLGSRLPCARMLLLHVYPHLRDAGEYGLALEFLTQHGDSLAVRAAVQLLSQVHYDSAAFVRRGQTSEALPFLEATMQLYGEVPGLPQGFLAVFIPQTLRKIAQCRQAEGNFPIAEDLLVKAEQAGGEAMAAQCLADHGLIRGGFRSLQGIVPRATPEANDSLRRGLEQGRECFAKAVDLGHDRATNALFALGVSAFLKGDGSSEEAVSYLQQALTGMVRNEEAYNEGNLAIWAKFCLATALLETMAEERYEHAADLVRQALESSVAFAAMLWERCLRAAAVFDNASIAEIITRHFLERREKEAWHLLRSGGTWKKNEEFRGIYLEFLRQTPPAPDECFSELDALLTAALGHAAKEQFAETLPESSGEQTALSGSGKKQKKNPMFGVDNWLVVGAVFRKTYAAKAIPATILRGIGTIVDKPPGIEQFKIPGAAKKRNWLKMAPKIKRKGNAVEITEEYMLSGPNGWLRDVYGQAQLEGSSE